MPLPCFSKSRGRGAVPSVCVGHPGIIASPCSILPEGSGVVLRSAFRGLQRLFSRSVGVSGLEWGILTMMSRSPLPTTLLMTLFALLSTGFHGCQKQSQPGFGQVETGMTREQVRTILGAPSSSYDREVDSRGSLLRLERWQYGDNEHLHHRGLLLRPSQDSVGWSSSTTGRVVGTRNLIGPRSRRRGVLHVRGSFDPPVPSRSR